MRAKGLFPLIIDNCLFSGIARKCDTVKVPFHSRSILPNLSLRSGSFRSWPLHPALVRVPVSTFRLIIDCFRLFPAVFDLGRTFYRERVSGQTSANNGQLTSIMAKSVNYDQSSQFWQKCQISSTRVRSILKRKTTEMHESSTNNARKQQIRV